MHLICIPFLFIEQNILIHWYDARCPKWKRNPLFFSIFKIRFIRYNFCSMSFLKYAPYALVVLAKKLKLIQSVYI